MSRGGLGAFVSVHLRAAEAHGIAEGVINSSRHRGALASRRAPLRRARPPRGDHLVGFRVRVGWVRVRARARARVRVRVGAGVGVSVRMRVGVSGGVRVRVGVVPDTSCAACWRS